MCPEKSPLPTLAGTVTGCEESQESPMIPTGHSSTQHLPDLPAKRIPPKHSDHWEYMYSCLHTALDKQLK